MSGSPVAVHPARSAVMAPSPVLSPEQHAQLMTLMREKPALTQEDIDVGHAYAAKRWAEYLAQPGWDEFMKAGQRADRFLADHASDLVD